ncbi:MAG: hypothetical protein EOP32_39605 [Rhodococcus sp. (in: high G+C Gram-positive bacteria)]|nr:MAG: hypothetical protein EOP32_39605 [Rhodococcus sp. (in: high G+C Gram-positive bacteria)]
MCARPRRSGSDEPPRPGSPATVWRSGPTAGRWRRGPMSRRSYRRARRRCRGSPTRCLGGVLDGVTPARWADVVAKGLENSEAIAIPGVGHDVISQSPCARSMMDAFFDDPNRPVDRSCLKDITIPPFETP